MGFITKRSSRSILGKVKPCFWHIWFVVVLWVCIGFWFYGPAYAWSIPDTGQTKCYDNDDEIPCPAPGEPFYGQDAQYQPQHPRSYTKLGLNGTELSDDALPADQGGPWLMTRDNVTGLTWEIKQNSDGTRNYANCNDADNTYTWYDSNPETNGGNAGTPGNGATTFDTEQFINALNAANYGGFDDWRMPTVKELGSLVNRGVYNPAVDTLWFPGTKPWWYWSSTTFAGGTNIALIVNFYSGYDNGTYGKNSSLYVRAVRGGQSGLFDDSIISGRMADNGDGTVTDTFTGLMWQQATAPGRYTWQQALAYAEGADTAGYNDWRLPNQNELKTLVDFTRYNLAIDPVAFPETAASWYWSSTTLAGLTHYAWLVYFRYGYGYGYYSSFSNYVRAVRGGQSGSLGHAVILSPTQASIWDIDDKMPIRWNTAGLGTNVKISLSRQGGKEDSFETIIPSTSNDGRYDWNISGPVSVNCVIKIEKANNPAIWGTEGLFIINTSGHPGINQPPVAKATADKTSVSPGEKVTFDGSGSSDPDGNIVNYAWFQIDTTGISVSLSNPNTVRPSFIAPEITEDSINLIFELRATDNDGASTAHTVRVTVNKSSSGNGGNSGNLYTDVAGAYPVKIESKFSAKKMGKFSNTSTGQLTLQNDGKFDLNNYSTPDSMAGTFEIDSKGKKLSFMPSKSGLAALENTLITWLEQAAAKEGVYLTGLDFTFSTIKASKVKIDKNTKRAVGKITLSVSGTVFGCMAGEDCGETKFKYQAKMLVD